MELEYKAGITSSESDTTEVVDARTLRARKKAQQEAEQKSFVEKLIGAYIVIFILFGIVLGPFLSGLGGNGSGGGSGAASSIATVFSSMCNVLGIGSSSSASASIEEPPIPKKDVKSVYDESLEFKGKRGLCEITIDNKTNDMPVYVRIWDKAKNEPVRALYIQEGDYFTVDNLAPGIYEVRYKELYENHIPPYSMQSDSIELQQSGKGKNITYTQAELKLSRRGVAQEGMKQINFTDV